MPSVKIHGRVFPATGFPPQDIIDRLMPYNFVGTPGNWAWADSYLKQVRKRMDEDPNFSVEQEEADRPNPPLSTTEILSSYRKR